MLLTAIFFKHAAVDDDDDGRCSIMLQNDISSLPGGFFDGLYYLYFMCAAFESAIAVNIDMLCHSDFSYNAITSLPETLFRDPGASLTDMYELNTIACGMLTDAALQIVHRQCA